MTTLVLGGDSLIGREFDKTFDKNKYLLTSRRDKQRIYFDLNEPKKIEIPSNLNNVVICVGSATFSDCRESFINNIQLNVINLLKTIEFFFKKKIKIIFLSSSSVFSNNNLLYENDIPMTIGEYPQIKRVVEIGIHNLANKFNGNFVIIRLTKVIGKNSKIIQEWKKPTGNKKILIHDGYKIYPLSPKYVVETIDKIIQSKASGIFHLSNKSAITYNQLFNFLENNNYIPKSFKVIFEQVNIPNYSNHLKSNRLRDELDIDFQSFDSFFYDLKNEINE